MRKNPVTTKAPAEQVVKDIRRATRKLHSSDEKIRIVISGFRGEVGIAELCRKEGLAQAFIAVGRRSSLRPARSGWPVTPLARPAAATSRTYEPRQWR